MSIPKNPSGAGRVSSSTVDDSSEDQASSVNVQSVSTSSESPQTSQTSSAPPKFWMEMQFLNIIPFDLRPLFNFDSWTWQLPTNFVHAKREKINQALQKLPRANSLNDRLAVLLNLELIDEQAYLRTLDHNPAPSVEQDPEDAAQAKRIEIIQTSSQETSGILKKEEASSSKKARISFEPRVTFSEDKTLHSFQKPEFEIKNEAIITARQNLYKAEKAQIKAGKLYENAQASGANVNEAAKNLEQAATQVEQARQALAAAEQSAEDT